MKKKNIVGNVVILSVNSKNVVNVKFMKLCFITPHSPAFGKVRELVGEIKYVSFKILETAFLRFHSTFVNSRV